ncbi:hypothetical protein [Polaribacter sp. P097]|uniref:hypothetical protein n=1 Tax=Polaribacter sp. P097 TaxID=3117398 RepID=UPI002FE35FB9
MKKFITKPHLFFFYLIPVFLILGFVKRNVPIDVSISYIYYLINVDFWCYVSAVYFGLIGLNYLALNWANKSPQNILTILHILLQIIALLPYLYAIFNLDETGNLQTETLLGFDLNSLFLISFFLFLVSIFIHLINFLASLFLKRD